MNNIFFGSFVESALSQTDHSPDPRLSEISEKMAKEMKDVHGIESKPFSLRDLLAQLLP